MTVIKIAKIGPELPRCYPENLVLGGRPMHDVFFNPGMSGDSIYQIGKEVDWWAADLAASYCSDLLRF